MDLQDDDEEMFFTPQTSTNLATLFNNSLMKGGTQDKQVSLVYKAPKQPNLTSDDSINNPSTNQIPPKNTKPQSAVICFKEVHSFKHISDSIQTLGKCGLALIGNEEFNIYQLLIYKQKTNILSSSKITESFEFCIQKNNYASINDDKNVHWSIQFYNEEDMKIFASTLIEKCLCKIRNDDNIDFLTESQKKNEKITENITCKINDNKGEDKEEKHVCVVTVPDNSKEIYIKGGGGEEYKVEQNDDNNSETLKKKASILSKVAKMGQKILTETNTSIEKEIETEKPKTDVSNEIIQKQMQQYQSQITEQIMNPKTALGNNLFPSMMFPQSSLHSTSTLPDSLNLFFVENRVHNSEFRMNLMKLQSSVDDLHNTIKMTCEPVRHETDEKLRSDNKKLQLILAKQKETMNALKSSLDIYKKRNEDLMKSEADHSVHLAALTEEAAKTAYEDHKRSTRLKELELQNQELNKKLLEYETKLENVHKKTIDCVFIQKPDIENVHFNIKEIMNSFFDKSCESFKTDVNYNAQEINQILAPITIDYTYKIINSIQQKFNDTKILFE